MSRLEDTAYAYVAARLRLIEADGPAILERAVEVDAAWHELHTAAGLPWGDCGELEPTTPRPRT